MLVLPPILPAANLLTLIDLSFPLVIGGAFLPKWRLPQLDAGGFTSCACFSFFLHPPPCSFNSGAWCLSLAFALQHGWQVQDRNIIFQAEGQAGAAKEGPPPLKLINNALLYAKELERIV